MQDNCEFSIQVQTDILEMVKTEPRCLPLIPRCNISCFTEIQQLPSPMGEQTTKNEGI